MHQDNLELDSMPIKRSPVNKSPRGQGKVIAVFSYRYDAHLVPGLLANIEPAVQGWVAFDDRPSSSALTDEPARRNTLIDAARADGADWILAVDPDERFEKGFWDRIGDMTRLDRAPALWTFQFCEMFAQDAWRVDGLWGAKRKMVLFPASVAKPSPAALHGGWVADASGIPTRSSQLRLYHLRMATLERRNHRRDTYASADPERQFQAIGYDYLADETGQVLRAIEPDRSFHPPFVEDGGLWAPPEQELVPGPPDPPASRIRFIDFARRRAGAAGTLSLATKLARRRGDPARPQRPATEVARSSTSRVPDVDFLGLAGQLALEAQNPRATDRLLSPALDAPSADPRLTAFLRLLRAQARIRLSDRKAVAADLDLLRRSLPNTPLIERLAEQARGTRRLDGPKAAWRRWAGAGTVMYEGEHVVTSAQMAVIIIGFCAPPELSDAVASVLTQDVPTEIVVVNTGAAMSEPFWLRTLIGSGSSVARRPFMSARPATSASMRPVRQSLLSWPPIVRHDQAGLLDDWRGTERVSQPWATRRAGPSQQPH
jgi:hypothetical protein